MSDLRYPNESREYRAARDQLLKGEQELIAKVKAVAAKRRTLPPGGALTEDYVFQWASVWVYWNMMDFTPEGRPDIQTPPQNFRSEFLEKHYLNK
jgi:predicted dithiol-disulfide oxidoreductase (DUF899 family)